MPISYGEIITRRLPPSAAEAAALVNGAAEACGMERWSLWQLSS